MNGFSIHTKGLTRLFGSLRAVDDLSIDVRAGEIFGFLGPNGSGKTTTIRLLLGLLEPTSGSAQVFGFDVATQADQIRERSGALLEHNGLYERLPALDNLDFYGRVWRIPTKAREERIKELLSHLGLWERRHEGVGTWSRGMKQKLAVARALLHRPQLLFLDEPTAGLDPVASATLRDDLASLAEREGVTIFLTTHNLAEAEKLCQTVALIRQGRLLTIGPPSRLRGGGEGGHLLVSGRGFSEEILLGLNAIDEVKTAALKNNQLKVDMQPGADAASVVSWLVGAGVLIDEVRREGTNLEEVFLQLVQEEAGQEGGE